jgi:hypothetical protein
MNNDVIASGRAESNDLSTLNCRKTQTEPAITGSVFVSSPATQFKSPIPPEAPFCLEDTFTPPDVYEEEDISFDRCEPSDLQLEKRGASSQIHTRELWEREQIHQLSILAKLREVGEEVLIGKAAGCHQDKSYRRCRGCGDATVFWNRCDLKWCPMCTPRLSRERKESVEWWTQLIKHPKHVVLTIRNFPILTKTKVLKLKHNLTRLRRSKFCTQRTVRYDPERERSYVSQPWLGGFYSLEVTNEGQGWHLHLHILVDCVFVDAGALSKLWAKIVSQEFGIVKVKDVRSGDYLREVTKYAVKGSQMASWSGHECAQFIRAFERVKTFGVFGSLFGRRADHAEFLAEVRDFKPICGCGCNLWEILTDHEFEWRTTTAGANAPNIRSQQIKPEASQGGLNL